MTWNLAWEQIDLRRPGGVCEFGSEEGPYIVDRVGFVSGLRMRPSTICMVGCFVVYLESSNQAQFKPDPIHIKSMSPLKKKVNGRMQNPKINIKVQI